MRKILDTFFMIACAITIICMFLTIFDPYGEWLIHKLLSLIGISILVPITALNLIYWKGMPDENNN